VVTLTEESVEANTGKQARPVRKKINWIKQKNGHKDKWRTDKIKNICDLPGETEPSMKIKNKYYMKYKLFEVGNPNNSVLPRREWEVILDLIILSQWRALVNTVMNLRVP
jgi:hypothetical protein